MRGRNHRRTTKVEYERCHQAAFEWIEAHYGEGVTIDDFCHESGYSRRSVQRSFAYEGETWRETLMYIRLENAGKLLINTDDTVGKIARSVGYRQGHQFAKAFKAEFGLTPLAYRQAFRNRSGAAA